MKKFGDARDQKDYKGSRSTMPARQRDGQVHAGGRAKRRAMRRLGQRQAMHTSKEAGHTMPGSMKP